MIRLVEALNFRCLRYVHQSLAPFNVMVGPNASGKTTFLDVVSFLGEMVSEGPDAAIRSRTQNFVDLLWNGKGDSFELGVEAAIPEERKGRLKRPFDDIRYEVKVGFVPETQEVGILEERVSLKQRQRGAWLQRELFPMEPDPPRTLMQEKTRKDSRTVLSKQPNGNDNFYSEVMEESGRGWYPSIRLGPHKSALGNLHEDQTRFPVSTWFKRLLAEGVQNLVLNSLLIRKPSPPGQTRRFKPDGSNLPWVVSELVKDKERFQTWIAHVRTALPDLETIRTVEREEDKHRYLKIHYAGGQEVPSWMASDGTLRLLALTILAYLPEVDSVYLIEEPENGIHPGAVETMYQSLSSVYGAQVLLATHSPVILSMAKAGEVLCFRKTESGATDIVLGSEHPQLKDWKGQPNLSVLFASGVL
jgi:predicted ATPase